VDHTEVLILQEKSLKVAKSMLRRWNVVLPPDELKSLVNLSIAEVLPKFDASKGTSIITFLYYHLKGALIKHIQETVSQQSEQLSEEAYLEFQAFENHTSEVSFVSESPEEEIINKQLTKIYDEALGTLSDLERELIRLNLEEGIKVQQIAKQLGFSRSYLSRLKSQALYRLCSELTKRTGLQDTYKALNKLLNLEKEDYVRRARKFKRVPRRRFSKNWIKTKVKF